MNIHDADRVVDWVFLEYAPGHVHLQIGLWSRSCFGAGLPDPKSMQLSLGPGPGRPKAFQDKVLQDVADAAASSGHATFC